MCGLVARVAGPSSAMPCAPGDRVVLACRAARTRWPCCTRCWPVRAAGHRSARRHPRSWAARRGSAADAEFVRARRSAGVAGHGGAGGRGPDRAHAPPERGRAARQVRYTFLLRVARQVGRRALRWGISATTRPRRCSCTWCGQRAERPARMLPATPLSDYHLLEDAAIACDPPLDDPRRLPTPGRAHPPAARPFAAGD